MSVHDERVQLRNRLEELVGVSGADILLDRPPGGWSELVTKSDLDLRFAASEARFDRKLVELEARLDQRFAAIDARFANIDHRFELFEHQLLAQVDRRLRQQSWLMISSIIAAMGIFGALLRF
jgi:hypothetical protein